MNNDDSRIRVLIADDFQLLREDLNETISAQDDMIVIGMAESGQKTVQLAEELDFDVLIIDIEMETMNAGIRAAEKVLAIKPDAKIIFLTAHETDEIVITSMATGAMDYIVKGGSDEELLAHIRSVYRGEPMLDARIQRVIMQEYGRLHRSEQSLLNFIQRVSRLTPAERALVRCLLDGYKVREIAEMRCVEVVTVKTQIKSLLRKFDCSRSREIVDLIRELGMEKIF
ncbi:MAG: response regulator transcription factor [Anaerolineaceae bacterium]|nr:response regulator transcription factor [Anaerolineaceae bacterium]